MRRDEFMKELEYLLQDIPDEDKADAIAYYQDYLEEAGPENEEKVIRDFGSPERIAAIIRADINGNLEDGGEFTENGYEDERFREPNFQLVKRRDLPEQRIEEEESGENRGAFHGDPDKQSAFNSGQHKEDTGDMGTDTGNRYGTGNEHRTGNGYGAGYNSGAGKRWGSGITPAASANSGKRKWEWWQILGIIFMGCCILPVVIPLVLGIGGGAIGLAFGLGGGALGILALFATLLVAMTIALAAVTFGLLAAGVLLIFISFGQMAASGIQGILCLGAGVGVFGLGLLCLSLCGIYYGMFLPWLIKTIISLINRLIHRNPSHAPIKGRQE